MQTGGAALPLYVKGVAESAALLTDRLVRRALFCSLRSAGRAALQVVQRFDPESAGLGTSPAKR